MPTTAVTLDRIAITEDITCIKLFGSVDIEHAERLEYTINSLIAAGCCRIVVDLRAVEEIGSCGWGVLLSKIEKIRHRHGDLKLVGMNQQLYGFYNALEFSRALSAYDSTEDALEDFARNVDASWLV